jgi:hypothetical protein
LNLCKVIMEIWRKQWKNKGPFTVDLKIVRRKIMVR